MEDDYYIRVLKSKIKDLGYCRWTYEPKKTRYCE